MSFDVEWDIEKHREAHESDEHWDLRRKFMERWKHDYPEERLVCLARVFVNIELMGCRYPADVMKEVSRLSIEVAKDYRNARRDKLKRTFVSASDAAEDRARGVKREGGIIVEAPPSKSTKIAFVRQGQGGDTKESDNESKSDSETESKPEPVTEQIANSIADKPSYDVSEYLKDTMNIKFLDIRTFNERMFQSDYGRLVLLIRPWTTKLCNIQSSCQTCNIPVTNTYENGCYTLLLNGKVVAQANGFKADVKSVVGSLAWNKLREQVISVVVKEQWIAQGDAKISVSDVTGKREEFGTPVENSVAAKMMKLMGWKGGGLGAESQGIAEPIKPNLQMVNRAGLGSLTTDIRQLRRAAQQLMQRYIAADTLDLDLVFSSDFSKDERAALHQVAQRAGLASRSYGENADRFLVVKKKLNPFSLVRAVIEKGGNTPKYQVFIPESLGRRGR